MGSLRIMSSRGKKSYSKDRCFQAEVTSDDKLIPEGIEGWVAYRVPLAPVAHQFIGRAAAVEVLCRRADRAGAATSRQGRTDYAGEPQGELHDIDMTVKAPTNRPAEHQVR